MSRNSARALALCAIMATMTAGAARAQVIDVQQPLHEITFGQASQWYGESFIPHATTSAGVKVGLYNLSSSIVTGTFTAQLWNTRPSESAATKYAENTVSYSLAANTPFGSPIDVSVFWEQTAVTPNQPYFLAFISSSTNTFAAAQGGNPYSDGFIWSNSSTTSQTFPPWASYELGNRDLYFVEYSEGPTVTPEPSSLVLLGSGLIGLLAVARRRRQARG